MSERAVSGASWAVFIVVFAIALLVGSCAGGSDGGDDRAAAPPTVPAPDSTPDSATGSTTAPTTGSTFVPPADDPDQLSAWGQLELRDGRLAVADGVTPYTLNTPLFSDYAHKLRTVWIPDGTGPAAFSADGPFDFPVGTVVTKTFYFAEPDDAGGPSDDPPRVARADPTPGVALSLALDEVRLVETRVLVHREDGWHGLPYVWDEAETEATLARTGAIVPLALVDDDGEVPLTYVVPDVNQCASCHVTNHSSGAIETIGLQARHLNTDVDLGTGIAPQLEQWSERGLLSGAPPADDAPRAAVWSDDTAPLESRARAYLDINCGHCHNPDGAADTSSLFLDDTTALGPSLGVCKSPVAAGGGTGGRLVDIAPGEPDESILVFRMETTDPGAMMPELGRSTTHTEGVDLIAQWIASLEGTC